MTPHPHAHDAETPEAITGKLFVYVVAATGAFFAAMALIFTFMK